VPTRAPLELVAIHSSLYAPGLFVSATRQGYVGRTLGGELGKSGSVNRFAADMPGELNDQRWDVSFSKAVIFITRR
jgi:hypothetical protein